MAATARALPVESITRPSAANKPGTQHRQLWLCAYFPDLTLESLHLDLTQAVAILETQKGKPCIHSLSITARAAGIETGMTPAAAQALCPNLAVHLRDSISEQLSLQTLAEAALAFSPWVSLQSPQSLLLEIRSCLNLFGGADALRESLRKKLLKLNHRPVIAITPSAAASQLLATLKQESIITNRQALRSLLGPLPIDALGLNDKTTQRLSRTGIRYLVDVWRLPRDGLARRYSASLLRQLDELAGLAQTSLPRFTSPLQFNASRDMPAELARIEQFFPAIVQLAEEFAVFLQTRDLTALGLTLVLRHYARPATKLNLNFRSGSRDSQYWLLLLQEKLQRTPLPAPVIAMTLQSDAIAAFQPTLIALFDDDDSHDAHRWQSVLDQLQARLGHTALQQPGIHNDHRPEYAQSHQPNTTNACQPLSPRPLWLLQQPKALNLHSLKLLGKPERIESGWWDGDAIRRDYWQAQDQQGRIIWVFKDLSSGDWFLHGLFG